MTLQEMGEVFRRLSDDENEFLKFKRVENPIHPRRDLCAFLMLDKLVPNDAGGKFIAGAGHDEIFLDTDCEELAKVVSEEEILTLVRCGVVCDSEENYLSMYV